MSINQLSIRGASRSGGQPEEGLGACSDTDSGVADGKGFLKGVI